MKNNYQASEISCTKCVLQHIVKRGYLTILFVIFFTNVFSQIPLPNGKIPGGLVNGGGNGSNTKWSFYGDNINSSSWLGSLNAIPLIFKTNNTEWLSIGIDGKLKSAYFAGSNGLLFHNDAGEFFSVLLDGDDTKFLSANGEFVNLPTASDWVLDGADLVNRNSGDVKINSGLKVSKYLIFTDPAASKISGTSGKLIFENTHVGFGINPDPLYTADFFGDVHISGFLYVEMGVIIGKKIKSERGVVDTVESKQMFTDSITTQKMASQWIETSEIHATDNAKINQIMIDGNTSRIYSLTGELNLGGNTLSNVGNINASYLNISGTTNLNRIATNKIVPVDSIISFGDSTLFFKPNEQRIYGGWSGYFKGLGLGLNTCAKGLLSTAIGCGVTVTAEKAIAMGSGSSYALVNNIENSLMIGFNSNLPTLFVGPADGSANSIGKVGIGTTTPNASLHISNKGGDAIGTHINPKIRLEDVVWAMKSGGDPVPNYNVWDIENYNGGLEFKNNYLNGDNPNPTTVTRLVISVDGCLGIGTIDTHGKKLAVAGDASIDGVLKAVEIRAQTNVWSDYVLKENYKLLPCKPSVWYILTIGS